VRNNFSLPTIVQALSEETTKLINWDFLSIILYDEQKHAWVVKKVTNRAHTGYVVLEQAIDFPESIVGQTIKSNIHACIDDLSGASKPRYFNSENLASQGSFLAVPISSLNKCYGAICLESREKFNFSRKDTEMLYRLTDNTASALEIFYLQDVVHEYVIIDDVTGAYSKKFFLQRIAEELQRSDDAAVDLSLLFITVDKSPDIAQRFGEEGFERVIRSLSKAIRSSIRSYDILGRYDENKFGILLINTAANDAYLWAEKIRKNIAALVIDLDGKSFSMTISVGVCGALEGMHREELLGNAVTVLNRAAEAGGNLVRVF
jgi:diguanylate cyclase (GGDEF)-like protein